MHADSRAARLADRLKAASADAFLAWSPVAVGYLTGLHESFGERFSLWALSASGHSRLICPALSATQARRAGIHDVRPWADGEPIDPHLTDLRADFSIQRRVLVDDEMPAAHLLRLQAAWPGIEFAAGSWELGQLMRAKEPEELQTLHRAGAIADATWAEVRELITVGMTELEIADLLTSGMKKRGGTPAFCSVGIGANGAEPHHHIDATPVKSGDVIVCDFGCELDHFHSDITRMIAIGEPEPEARQVYATVLKAHNAARAAIRPGATVGEVDGAARRVIEEAGYGEFFFHRTGHGLGRKIHEEPYIVPAGEERLQVGDVFSIEPGIYLAGRFGIRIENIVYVTESGHTSLNAEPEPELFVRV